MFQPLEIIITIYKSIIILVVIIIIESLWKCSSYRIIINYLEKHSKFKEQRQRKLIEFLIAKEYEGLNEHSDLAIVGLKLNKWS